MIYISTNTKGGVGKSLTSVVLACLLQIQNRKFKVIELDNNNQSLLFKNSDFLTEENSTSFEIDLKENVIGDMLFDLMSDSNMDYIVDVGGGDDTLAVLKLLKSIELEKKYIIPTTRIKKYLKNANDTFEFINDPENTYFLLNQYSNLEKITNEFIYFHGDKRTGVKPVSENFKTKNCLMIPFCNSFQIAEDQEMTILDLANISRTMSEAQARDIFFKQAAGDRDVFTALMQNYWNSEIADQTLTEIEGNFEELFKKSGLE